MENLYFIPLEKDQDEFLQTTVLNTSELLDYNFLDYRNVIENHFISSKAIVNLKTGKFITDVFLPKNPALDVYFCLVNKDNFPNSESEVSLSDENIDEIKEILSIKIKYSEGIVAGQSIDILTNFVTPRLKFYHSKEEVYYHLDEFNRDCIILGAPGSGKTTLLRRLTFDLLNYSLEQNNKLNKLPIYIQLRDYNKYNNDFDSYIDNCIYNSFVNTKYFLNSNTSKTGNLYLLLDGADELDYEKFQSFKETITTYKKKNPLISFIITSRPDKSYENIYGFRKCDVKPFNKSQIKELTFRNLWRSGNWKSYISILNSVPDIYEVLKNPLLLTISHFLFLHKSIIPLNTGHLLRELVSTLISNWDSQRNVERKLNNKIVNPIEVSFFLGKMSLALAEQKKVYISIDELYNYFTDYDSLENFQNYLNFIEFSTGLIRQSHENVWGFVHKSIQDFFCSNFLIERIGGLNKKIFSDNDWEKVLYMISGLSSEPNYVIENILSEPNKDENDKIRGFLSIFNESVLLSRTDIKSNFDILENYFVCYEVEKGISIKDIKIYPNNITIKSKNELTEIKKVIQILYEIFKVRFTKYEHYFFSYLSDSTSNILKAISNVSYSKGNIVIDATNYEFSISYKEESPDIEG